MYYSVNCTMSRIYTKNTKNIVTVKGQNYFDYSDGHQNNYRNASRISNRCATKSPGVGDGTELCAVGKGYSFDSNHFFIRLPWKALGGWDTCVYPASRPRPV